MVGDMPISMIHPIYSAWALKHGHPPRTAAALRVKAQELFPSIAPVGEWLQVGDVARFCGTTRHQVARWMRMGHLSRSRHPDNKRGRYYINRASLRQMVKTYPWGFDLATREGLWALLEDHRLVDWLLATRESRQAAWRPAGGSGRPVIKLSTGKRYPSVNHAAVLHGTNRWGVLRSIRSEGRLLLDGSAWAYAS